MTTYGDVITAAHGYSSKSRPDEIATRETELLALASRSVRGIFAVASRIAPEYWGQSDTVAHVGAGWARPTNAHSVFRIERTSDKANVAVVPFDDRAAERSQPAVYLLGRTYRIAASGVGPTSGDNLDIYYSRIPAKPVALTDDIDPEWEESFDNFLAVDIAIYLALKDGRMDELAVLTPARDHEAALFVEFLANNTPAMSFRFGQPRRVAVPSIIPLLAGGARA